MASNETQFILYQLPEEEGVIQVVVKDETIWATRVLKEYIRKGYALDDNRLKNLGGGGYWKELLERIRDIRSSEKIFLTTSNRCPQNDAMGFAAANFHIIKLLPTH